MEQVCAYQSKVPTRIWQRYSMNGLERYFHSAKTYQPHWDIFSFQGSKGRALFSVSYLINTFIGFGESWPEGKVRSQGRLT